MREYRQPYHPPMRAKSGIVRERTWKTSHSRTMMVRGTGSLSGNSPVVRLRLAPSQPFGNRFFLNFFKKREPKYPKGLLLGWNKNREKKMDPPFFEPLPYYSTRDGITHGCRRRWHPHTVERQRTTTRSRKEKTPVAVTEFPRQLARLTRTVTSFTG